jgi:hypothetical protein
MDSAAKKKRRIYRLVDGSEFSVLTAKGARWKLQRNKSIEA